MRRVILAAGMALALVSAEAGVAVAQTKTIPGEMKTVTATIAAIEQSSRTVTLKEENGEYTTVIAPASVTRFDAMKVGDKVSVRYYDNVVVRVKAPNEKAVNSDTGAMTKTPGEKPGGTVSTQRTITATITQLDPTIPSITFTGPNGWKYSSHVQDKDSIKNIKVGDRVDITWTEAATISVVTPAKK